MSREEVDERRRALFQSSGITTHRQLLQRPLWDVAHAVDMSVRETEELMVKLSIRLAPPCRSAFDLFLESANQPAFLRTGLTHIDQALNGGLHCRAMSEFVGTAGIGKSQMTMTLAVVCAINFQENSVMFFDTEHNFSAKRLLQITIARIRLTHAGRDADINELAAAIIRRIRVVKVKNVTAFVAKFKEMENAMHSLKIKLVIVDCFSTLFKKVDESTYAERQHQMLRMARDLKLFADTYQAFVVVTNRATTVEGEGLVKVDCIQNRSLAKVGHTASPQGLRVHVLQFIMERHSLYRAMTIVKSSIAGYVVQPFTVKEGGIEAVEDEEESSRQPDSDEFAIHDDLLSDLAMAAVPTVDPANTLRSTQQSNSDDPDATQLISQSDDDVQNQVTSNFDIVSDSNSEDESFWDVVTEE
ncbi:DNA repair protein RAD51 2 [Phytophthora citrophthora]|uniref:DNA repair protein RAD51 2 n=1 Tax=Phytophthora citrophthora TaxID=4793 RepID=A0AAD9G648_9STRA|nr:DNA repair protein RAD51 2 [Phytophthora citrophthora]